MQKIGFMETEMNSRNLYFYTTGEDDLPSFIQLHQQLIELDDGKELFLHISSDGGSVAHGLMIYDTIKAMKSKVTTIGYGGVSSIAVILLQAGNRRILTKNSDILIHNISIDISGGLGLIKNHITSCERQQKIMYDIIIDRCTEDKNLITQMIESNNSDLIIGAEEALSLGLIDGVLNTYEEL